MYKILTICLTLLLMYGCSQPLEITNDWFKLQGFNLTECGPSATANVLRWGGNTVTNEQVRSYYPKPTFWTLFNIKGVLINYSSISSTFIHSSIENIERLKKGNNIGIFYINNSHFVLADYENGYLMIYDSLYGIYQSDEETLYSMISRLNTGRYDFIEVSKNVFD